MKGILSTTDLDDASLVEKARRSPGLVGRDLTREVMPARVDRWEPGFEGPSADSLGTRRDARHRRRRRRDRTSSPSTSA